MPNVGSKAREGAKAMRLAFVLLDFQLPLSCLKAGGGKGVLVKGQWGEETPPFSFSWVFLINIITTLLNTWQKTTKSNVSEQCFRDVQTLRRV